MSQPLRVLIVASHEPDAQLVLRQLREGGYEPQGRRVESPVALTKALEVPDWDVIIADYLLPEFTALDALGLVQTTGQDVPFILVSGAIGEEQAAKVIKAGAHGYLLKDGLAQLAGVVEQELAKAGLRRQNRQAEAALRESEERYALAVAGSNDGIWDWNIVTGEEIISDRGGRMLGYQPGELPSKMATWRGLIHPDDLAMVDGTIASHLERRTPCDIEFRMLTQHGGYRWFHVRGQAVWNAQGQPYCMAGSVSDITQRKHAQDEIRRINEGLEQRIRERTSALRESEERFRMMVSCRRC